ncbi:MAG: tetratricopeptide repeat protein [Terriglobia bacterium]
MNSWWQKRKAKTEQPESSNTPNIVDPYKEGIRLYESGQYVDAYRYMAEALQKEESGQRWNDWAAVQLALKNLTEAERGFRKAVDLDPDYSQAHANLGALLAQQGRKAEAIPFLEKALAGIDPAQKSTLEKFLSFCKQTGAPGSNVSSGALKQIAHALSQQQAALNSISIQVTTLSDALSHLLRQPAKQAALAPEPKVNVEDFPVISQAQVLTVPNSFTMFTAGDPNFGLAELGLIASLLKSTKADRIFNLGDADGQATLNLAANSDSDVQIYTLLASPGMTPAEQPYHKTRYQSRVVEISGNSAEFESSDLHGTFDFVLIDAGREPSKVMSDSRLALKLLRNGSGMIVWRNAAKPGDSTSTCLRELALVESRLARLRRIEGTSLVFADFGAKISVDAVTAKPIRARRAKSSARSSAPVTGRTHSRRVTFAAALAEAGEERIQDISGSISA